MGGKKTVGYGHALTAAAATAAKPWTELPGKQPIQHRHIYRQWRRPRGPATCPGSNIYTTISKDQAYTRSRSGRTERRENGRERERGQDGGRSNTIRWEPTVQAIGEILNPWQAIEDQMSSKPLAWVDQPSPRLALVRRSSWKTVRSFAQNAFPGVTMRKVVQSFSAASLERQLYLGHQPRSGRSPSGAQVGRTQDWLYASPPAQRPQSAVVASVRTGLRAGRERTFNRPLSPPR